ncbi:GFA family protein [Aquicoccus sp. SCR17]|nr:GFA family protein [Carideicomes alvinocaridis]
MLTGRCLCGAITYEVTGKPQGPSACHCGQCRRQSGNVWASAYVPKAQIAISGPVKWYASSDKARRGFCPDCGSVLFWDPLDEDLTSFSLGSLDAPTGLRIGKHIFVAEKGDYYEITGDVPQVP